MSRVLLEGEVRELSKQLRELVLLRGGRGHALNPTHDSLQGIVAAADDGNLMLLQKLLQRLAEHVDVGRTFCLDQSARKTSRAPTALDREAFPRQALLCETIVGVRGERR